MNNLFDTMRDLLRDATRYDRGHAQEFALHADRVYGVNMTYEQALCLIVDVQALVRRAVAEYGLPMMEQQLEARAAVSEAERHLGFAH